MTLPDGTVLSFWTAAPMMIAANGRTYEREGQPEKALSMWKAALCGTPADDATRTYCSDRIAAIEAGLRSAPAQLSQGEVT